MPLHLSNNLKECIVQWYYIDRMTMEEIRDLAKCSIGLVYNVIRNYRDFGQVRNPFTHRAGQPWTKYPPFYIERKAWCTDLLWTMLDKNRTQDLTALSTILDFAPEPFATRRSLDPLSLVRSWGQEDRQQEQLADYLESWLCAIVWLRYKSRDCFRNVSVFTKICKGQ